MMKYIPMLLLCGISAIQASPYIDGNSGICVFHISSTGRTEPLEGEVSTWTDKLGNPAAGCTWYGEYDPQPDRDVLWFQDTGPCVYFDPDGETIWYSTRVINTIISQKYSGLTAFGVSCGELQPLF